MTRPRPSHVVVVFGIGFLAAPPARSQSGYRAANGETAIAPRESGFVRGDLADISFALQYVLEWSSIGLAPYASAAARKSQYDIFSAFDFNPGFEGGLLAFVQLGGGPGAADVVSLRLGFANTQRKLYEFSDDSSTVSLTEVAQWDLAAAGGVTLRLAPSLLVGFGGSARREWSSPGTTRAVEVCVGGSGPGVVVPLCADRFPAPLRDYWAGQVRADLIWEVAHLGSARSLPRLATFSSASADVGHEAPARLNLGAGIGVTTASFAGQPIVVLFLEMYDIGDATRQDLTVADRFVIRLSLTIPFQLLTER